MSEKPCEANFTDNDCSDESEEQSEPGHLFEVRISFNHMHEEEILRFLNSELGDGHIILEVRRNYARFLWPLEYWEDMGELEIPMYYMLDGGKIGKYDYSYIDTYYQTTST